ncbi:SDR family NAD(P)-dependent oxidoreductase [Aegicerativicinus sediminis]|uniref:SDR family NAD(P)-dependent oxidoreductase n=1 Tax=Aegicerativicinus sediminis TaxID=2893202 RepID=UPI001E517410|nr:SDR family NAD(P)-dependent oxidoreductase [Aegicerativicinus sediminis]
MKTVDFKNKVVWITGASSGIGASLAIQLNQLGATIIASARRSEKLTELKKSCQYPNQFITLELDITDSNSIKTAINAVEGLKQLDLVIHNAGIAQKGMVIENEMEIDRQIMETNYFGTVAFTKAIMPKYLDQGHGWFAVVSSFAGVMGIPGRSAYAASKHALHGFFESLQAENMNCNLDVSFVIPGFINTEITAKGLCGNGKPFGRVETSHKLGMTADQCAKDTIKGLMKKRQRIVVGKFEVYLLSINRISPRLGRLIIKSHPMKRIRLLKKKITNIFNFGANHSLEPQLTPNN